MYLVEQKCQSAKLSRENSNNGMYSVVNITFIDLLRQNFSLAVSLSSKVLDNVIKDV